MPTSSALASRPDAEAIEQVLINGDLSRLSPAQRISYYKNVCDSLGLNPLTKPFDYISLSGKLVLYAKRDATDQLRNKRSISVQIVGREVIEDCYIVTARASMSTGRQDESTGVVPIANLKGEARANALMKAETKAKRRVTLSICGLGMLDETEVESSGAFAAPTVAVEDGKPVNVETGEELPEPPKGYHYVSGYKFANGWHEFRLLNFDAQGGSIKLSTKKNIGSVAEQAQADRIPVKVTTVSKRNAIGEAYLDSIEKLKLEDVPTLKSFAKPAPTADAELIPMDESEIPF